MTIDKFNHMNLAPLAHVPKDQLGLQNMSDYVKAFAYLCLDECEETFGTKDFKSPVDGLNKMSNYFMHNAKSQLAVDKAEAMTQIRSFATCKMWEQYKTTYKIDPTFYSVFKDTKKLKVFPTELKYIPVPSFAIDLTQCPDCEASALYVTVCDTIGGVTLCICALYEANLYQTLATIRYEDCVMENGLLTYDWKKSKIFNSRSVAAADKKLRDDTRELIEKQFNGDKEAFLTNMEKVDKDTADKLRQVLDTDIDYETFSVMNKETEELKMFIFQFLTYLSCKNPDIRESRDSKKATQRAIRMGAKEAPQQIYEVGKRFGKRYQLMVKEQEIVQATEGAGEGDSHASPRPHLVSAHWHGYWCGTNNSDFQYRWLACYFKGGIESAKDCDEIVHECEENHHNTYSHGEKMLYNTLDNLKLEHIPQYRVETGRIFDDCVKLHGRDVMIEIDGEQHFKPVRNWDYEATVASDTEKNEYCKSHNIPLLRIRYDELLHIADILQQVNVNTLSGFPEDCWLSEKSMGEYYSIREEKEIV